MTVPGRVYKRTHTVSVDPEYGDWRLNCHWAPDDDRRPCWPRNGGVPDPAFEHMCNYREWADNTDGWLRGRLMTFEVEADYDQDIDCYTFTIVEDR